MTLCSQLTDYINAAFSGIWIHTQEADEAEREILRHGREHDWRIAVWDVANGLRTSGTGEGSAAEGIGDPLAALRSLTALSDSGSTSLLLLHNFHRFLSSPEVIQATITQLLVGKRQRTFLMVLAPVVQLPVELEKLFVVIEHALPDRTQLEQIACELLSDDPDDLPKEDDLQRVLDAAAGLTRYEAEAAFALSLTRHSAIQADAVWEIKAQTLRKNNLLTLHCGHEMFDSLGGIAHLKDFCRRALGPRSACSVRPRGVLLLGPPGAGKSAFAKALGNETGRPTLTLDMGALYGSLVGKTEQNVRQALQIADAMSPSIVFVDEVEKALSGVGGLGDSGVSTRLFGTLLTWLSDRTSDTFFVGTCNDISKLPPEFSRAERFDGFFFLDVPNPTEKKAIWQLYREQFQIPATQVEPGDSDWTGAEIRSCCRLAALLDVPLTQASRNVVPVAVTAAESVEKLRNWASSRCLSATEPGIYRRDGASGPRRARRISRPTDN